MRLARKEKTPAVLAVPPGKSLVLHVGCGSENSETLHPRFRGHEWHEVRLDIDPGVQPDIVASIIGLEPVQSDSVDAIWSSHNLEHVWAHEVPLVLDAFFRVLRPGGEALITLPDLQQVGKLVAAGKLEDTAYVSPAGPIAPLDIIYGLQAAVRRGNEFMGHRTGFTAKTLKQKLVNAGFENVKVDRPGDFALWASAYKPA